MFLGYPARSLHYSHLCQALVAMRRSPLEVSPTRGDLEGGVGEAPPRSRELRSSFFLRPLCRLQPSPTPSPPLPNPSCLLPTHSSPMAWPQVSPELPSTFPESTESPNPVVLATQGIVSRPRTPVCPLAQARPICRSKSPNDLKIETSLITHRISQKTHAGHHGGTAHPTPPPAP